jgi:hypothetical protein
VGIPRGFEQFLVTSIVVSQIGAGYLGRCRCRQIRIAFEDYGVITAARTTRDPCGSRGCLILTAEHHGLLLGLKQFFVLRAVTCSNDPDDDVQEATATAANATAVPLPTRKSRSEIAIFRSFDRMKASPGVLEGRPRRCTGSEAID